MLRLRRRLLAAAPLAFALLARVDSASADNAQCFAASEHAQELKNAGKLNDARAQLAICSKSECPKLVQDDCTKWMGEVLGSLPSIVPAAKDEGGHDVVEAKLFVDGTLATSIFDGKPVPIDPGVHTLRFEREGSAAQEERVVVKSSEKNRIVSVKLVALPPATRAAVAAPKTETSSSVPVLPIALGAAGVVIGAAALVLDFKATSDAHDLRSSCAPHCAQSDVDSAHTKYVIAGIGAGIGVAAIIVAGVLYFRHKRSDVGFGSPPMSLAQGRISF